VQFDTGYLALIKNRPAHSADPHCSADQFFRLFAREAGNSCLKSISGGNDVENQMAPILRNTTHNSSELHPIAVLLSTRKVVERNLAGRWHQALA
jgi:hypothetical protein